MHSSFYQAAKRPPDNAPSGCWNAYVAAGSDRDQRRRRLDEAPEHLRVMIRRHMEIVYAVKTHQRRARR